MSKLKDENLKCFLDPDAFSVATVENIDERIPHARSKVGESNYGFHGTSVQSVQAKPISMKNHPEDYIMFTRNLNADENEVFKKVKIFGYGRCLFRSFASRLYQPLLLCNRHSSGAPVDPRLLKRKKS